MRPEPPSSEEVAEHWHDIVHFSIDAFGPNRCMFESNFPLDRESAAYSVLWNAFKKIAAGRTEEEKQALFSGTASRVYRLD